MVVTERDIVAGLGRLGLEAGSVVVVHSSLSSFGHVEGGAETVIAALKSTVTPSGLLIMPTHTYCLKGRPGVQPFDPRTTPSETGIIPSVFWHQGDVVRSRHPTHSVAAWGDRAAELVADHDRRGPVGHDSPLDRAATWGGHVLQMGTSHGTNTTLHLAEVLADVPYLATPYRVKWGTTALVLRDDGSVDEVEMVANERPGCSGGFRAVEPLLEAGGLTRETTIGRCRARLTRMSDLLRVAVEMLRLDPAALLCRRPECEHCSAALRAVEAARRRGQAPRPAGSP